MTSIVEPPPSCRYDSNFFQRLQTLEGLSELITKINDNYDYWTDIKYRKLSDGVNPQDLWCYVKFVRRARRSFVWKKYNIGVTVTDRMQEFCHDFDMNFGGSWSTDSIIPSEKKDQYLISSIMEEAISSSQMEGASTTRKVAKEMLRKGRPPHNKADQMIFNNYRTIQFIVENRDQRFSPELLLRIHASMTDKTLDNPQDQGRFRTNNEVVVENGISHEVVYAPPSYEEIPEFIEDLCRFFNDEDKSGFIHPVIRGVIIHFMIAYVHPFVDGNGRTARALFYWYMLRKGYWLTQFLSISRIIKGSKKSYEQAFLHTEADENDMGYFINYNLRVLKQAFEDLKKYLERKLREQNTSPKYLRFGNERQALILQYFEQHPESMLTIKEITNRFAVSSMTAGRDLSQLVERGLVDVIQLNKVKRAYVKGQRFDEILRQIK